MIDKIPTIREGELSQYNSRGGVRLVVGPVIETDDDYSASVTQDRYELVDGALRAKNTGNMASKPEYVVIREGEEDIIRRVEWED